MRSNLPIPLPFVFFFHSMFTSLLIYVVGLTLLKLLRIEEIFTFVVCALFWWQCLPVVLCLKGILVILHCFWNRDIACKPKIVARLLLKYCNSSHECAICLEPFTHQAGCVSEASTSNCRPESQQPTDSVYTIPTSSVVMASTPVMKDITDTADSASNISQCSKVELYDNDNDKATCMTPCGHCFHYICLIRSLKINSKCPYCQQYINLNRCFALHQAKTKEDMIGEPRVLCPCNQGKWKDQVSNSC